MTRRPPPHEQPNGHPWAPEDLPLLEFAAKPRSRTRRTLRALVRFAAIGITFHLVVAIASFVFALATTDGTIPPSCRQPSGVDYSQPGGSDYGPYSVKFKAWTNLPWARSSEAIVGHGQTAGSLMDSGVVVKVDSTEIDAFRCRWSTRGVTIIEPPDRPGVPGNEHFVPASRFLGGR